VTPNLLTSKPPNLLRQAAPVQTRKLAIMYLKNNVQRYWVVVKPNTEPIIQEEEKVSAYA